MTARTGRRLRIDGSIAAFAAVIFIPLLLTRPGRVGADTKSYLYLDPARMLSRAPQMWDEHIGLGTVTHQNIGYLWPIGPFYRLADLIGLPDWVAQRLWLGLILLCAGLGARFMLRAMGRTGPGVAVAMFLYGLTPYVLTLAARLSVILLPYAGLPWLIGLAVLALRRGGWRYPAWFALVVATIGSVNATSLILVCVGPILWLAHEVFLARRARFTDAVRAGLRISVLTLACSLWWIAGLWAQGGWGIEILRYTETARTVALASVSLEVLRGFGYWFFYGDDRFGPWIAPSRWYTERVPILALSFLVPAIGLVGAVVTRFRERVYFLLLLLIGMILAVGGHPWDDGAAPVPAAFRFFLESDAGLSMRSLPRAAPLVMLALAVFSASLVEAIGERRPTLVRPVAAGVMVLAVLNLSPLLTGRMVDHNLDRAEDIPGWWDEAARLLDERDDGTRVLELPGSDFASYRWGNTVDPVLPGLMDRPYVARELIPYGTPPAADLLNALDVRMQELIFEPASLAPIARLMAVGDVSVRGDLSYERYNTPRPRRLWDLLRHAPGVDVAAELGPAEPNVARPHLPLQDEQELLTPPDLPNAPEVGILRIDDTSPIVRTRSSERPVIVAGSGDGLVDLAGAGLIDGSELLLYSASFHEDPDALVDLAGDTGVLILTDSNRRSGRRWGTVRDNRGMTRRADEEPMRDDPSDQPLEVFDTDDPATMSVAVPLGPVRARATSYGNLVSFTPEDRAANAVDGDLNTAWRTGGFGDAEGEAIELRFDEPVSTDRVRLLQMFGGHRNRVITEVSVRLDDGEPMRFELDESSRPERVDTPDAGQTVTFPETTFETLTITIERTDPRGLRRYDGISPVGFAEIAVAGEDGEPITSTEAIRLPTDLLDVVGDDALDHELVVSLTRWRTAGTVAVRSSPEPALVRLVELPTARTFGLTGQVRLSDDAVGDQVLDRVLGVPDHEDGGVTATSSRHLPGGPGNRAHAAIDGDPDTWWSPGFLDQGGDWLRFRTAEPIEVAELDLVVLRDGRHSVPRRLEIAVARGDGDPVRQIVELGDIPDDPEPNSRVMVPVRLDEPVTGDDITITIPEDEDEGEGDPDPAVREVLTRDYFSDADVPMPIGIVEVGIDGLRADPVADMVDPACRSDLLSINGEPLPVRVVGGTADLLAGRPVDLEVCGPAPELAAGTNRIEAAAPYFTGLDIDRLVLRSAPGGGAREALETIGAPDAPAPPRIETRAHGPASYELTAGAADTPYWLVLGQSHSEGWRLTVDGEGAGPPTLVDGYANGWLLPAGGPRTLHLEWTPQRVVWFAIWASVIAIAVALVIASRPRRLATVVDSAVHPPVPRPRLGGVLSFGGAMPSIRVRIGVTLTAGLFGLLVIGPIPGLVLAVAAATTVHLPRWRPVLTIGGPAIFALCVGLVCARQVLAPLPGGFDWPGYFETVHQPAWTAVGLIALDPLIGWARRRP